MTLEQTGLSFSFFRGVPVLMVEKIRNEIKMQFFVVSSEDGVLEGNDKCDHCKWMTLKEANQIWGAKDGQQQTEDAKLWTELLPMINEEIPIILQQGDKITNKSHES